MRLISSISGVLILLCLGKRSFEDSCLHCRYEAGRIMLTGNDYYRLGEVMDIDNDRLVIGNYDKEEVFILKNDKNSWKQEARLHLSQGVQSHFGRSVGIKGNRVVVGVLNDNIGNIQNSGSAYVFKNVNSTWVEEVKLVPNDPGWYHYCGYSVAIDGPHVIVGCPYYEGKSGAVYIFKNIGSKWKQQTKLIPSDGMQFNIFGHSLAIDGKYVVVGTLHNNGNIDVSSGAAYVFKNYGNTWFQQAKLNPERKLRDFGDDEFGYAIAIKHDHIIVGCPGDDVNGISSGAAYIYKKEGINWAQSVKLSPTDGVPNDYFGSSVDITDGFAVVGSRRGHYSATQPGVAYIFQRLGKQWVQGSKLVASDHEHDANFGFSTLASNNHIVVGCPWCQKRHNKYLGSVYTFSNIDN